MRKFIACVVMAFAFGGAPATASARVISFIGDSTTSPLYSPPGYPVLVGNLLGVKTHNLAVKYPPSYSTVQALREELPHLPADTTDAVIFLGLDDLRSLAEQSQTLSEVRAANAEIIAALRARNVRVYELTLHDYTKDPMFVPQSYDIPLLGRMSRFVDELNAYYRATPGVTIVDAGSWHDVYSGRWSPDGIHCNADSLKRFAAHLAQALVRP